ERIISFVVDGRTGTQFGGKFLNRNFEHRGRFQFFFVGLANVVPTMRQDVLAQGAQGCKLFGRVIDQRRLPQNHHRAVIHGVIENGAGKHQSVKQRDGDADGNAQVEVAQHAAGGRSVDVEHVSIASIGGRDNVGLAVGDETNVAEEAFV